MKKDLLVAVLVLGLFISCSERETIKPVNFDKFWNEAISELDSKVVFEKVIKDSIVGNKIWSLFRIQSYKNVHFYAWVSEPLQFGKYPVKIRFSGMSNANPDYRNIPNSWFLKENGTINMMVDIRGQGLSTDLIKYDNYLLNGLKSKDTYIYKGAYIDAVRSVDFISSHSKCDGNIIVTGSGQGGALAIVASALNSNVTMCIVGFPFFCDIVNYNKREWPLNVYLNYCKNNKVDYFEIIETLSFFDILNFTEYIKVPIFITTQEIDKITPKEGAIKFFERLKAINKEIHVEFCEGHGCSSKSTKVRELEKEFIKNNLNFR